jgi:nicotinamidase-related amidase
MPLTKLDPTPALVVIDLQKGIAGLPLAHPIAGILANTARLVRAFRERGLPVVLVNVNAPAPGRTDTPRLNTSAFPPDWTDLVPELEAHPTDLLITKRSWGAFVGTSLDEQLRQREATQIILTGVATSAGVESTARSAHDHGYHVVFVTDAMTDRSIESHAHSIEKIFPRIGEVDTTENVLRLFTA